MLKLYENSLALLFFLLFFLSIWLHAVGGARAYSAEQLAHGEAAVSTWQYVMTSQFWFESFQNWQSEFLAVASSWERRSICANAGRRSRSRSPSRTRQPGPDGWATEA